MKSHKLRPKKSFTTPAPDLLPGQPGERAAPRRPVRRDRPQLQPGPPETASRTIHSQTAFQVFFSIMY